MPFLIYTLSRVSEILKSTIKPGFVYGYREIYYTHIYTSTHTQEIYDRFEKKYIKCTGQKQNLVI